MIGYKISNLKIIGVNHSDLLYLYDKAYENFQILCELINTKKINNVTYIRINKNDDLFFIIRAMNEEPFIQLFVYDITTDKLFESATVESFIKIFSKDYFIRKILSSLENEKATKLLSSKILEAIDNYIDKYPNLTTEDYNDLDVDDFEIKHQDISERENDDYEK